MLNKRRRKAVEGFPTGLARLMTEHERTADWVARQLKPQPDPSTVWRWAMKERRLPDSRVEELAAVFGAEPEAVR